MNIAQAMIGVNACAQWLVALLLIVVGGLVVRKAHPTAGTLFAGAGAAHLLAGCCSAAPSVWLQVDIDLYLLAGPFMMILGTGAQLLTGGLLIASFVQLARHVIAKGRASNGVVA